MQILVIDVGGTHVKVLATGQQTARKFLSGPTLTPEKMVAGVLKAAEGWQFEAASIGYPGPVLRGKPVSEPHNLAPGWVGFNFEAALKCPIKLINDAAMQALGSYKQGKMLFLGLGTGLGSAMIVDGIVEPMELAHLPYKKGTYEDYVGVRGLERVGKKKWRHYVDDVVALLVAALEPDDVVLGGGNVKRLKTMPPRCRAGDNRNAFLGGFRLWEDADRPKGSPAAGETKALRVGIAVDHGGFGLKKPIVDLLQASGHEVTDFGAYTLTAEDDYPDFVLPLAQAVAAGKVDRGIAICGSGVGACIAANKVARVRAALITDAYSAHQGVEHDDMNLICLGARVVSDELARDLVRAFLAARYTGEERHRRRLAKVAAIEFDGT